MYKDKYGEPYVYVDGHLRPLSYSISMLKAVIIMMVIATLCFTYESDKTWEEKINNMDAVYVGINGQIIEVTQTEEIKDIFSAFKKDGLNVDYKYDEKYFIVLADEDSGEEIVFYPALENNNVFIRNNEYHKVSKKSGEKFEDIIEQYLR